MFRCFEREAYWSWVWAGVLRLFLLVGLEPYSKAALARASRAAARREEDEERGGRDVVEWSPSREGWRRGVWSLEDEEWEVEGLREDILGGEDVCGG